MEKPEADRRLAAAARGVLGANDTGRWTKPSVSQYPHQWNWDSGFISLGWATFDWERAALEIESMLAARWREGMLPSIHYDRAHIQDYFPGPDFWPRAQLHVAEPGRLTSGVSNPPVLVLAALRVGRRQAARGRRLAFWRRTYPALRAYVEYLAAGRQLPGSPLVAVVHPWESGWDNSPRWDHLRSARLKPDRPYVRLDTRHVGADERPGDRDYDAYLALVELLERDDYDVAVYRRHSPFVVYDVLFDALWHRAATALVEIAGELGEEAPISKSQLEEFAAAFEQTHWDPQLGLYLDWDCVSGHRIARPTAAGLAALAGGLAQPERARAAWERYSQLAGDALPVCTVPPGDPAFDSRRYWRGPVWVNVNWLVAEGLEHAGLATESAGLRAATLDLVRASGFAEYFDANSGAACGAQGFSWTAALALELLERN